MKSTIQNQLLSKFGNIVSSRLDKYEMILAFVLAVALILKALHLDMSVLIAIVLNILAVFYFLTAFSLADNTTGGLEVFMHKLAYVSSSVVTIGILFRIQHWPGNDIMLLAGCGVLIVVLAMTVIFSIRGTIKGINRRFVLRILTLAVAGTALYFSGM